MTEHDKPDSDISLKIKTVRGDLERDFPKNTRVKEVIKAVVQHFGFSNEGKYELKAESDADNPLDPDQSLANLGLKDHGIFVLTDLGVAV